MPLGLRIFLLYFFFTCLTGYFILNKVINEIQPSVRQSTEETLVDTAWLLATLLRDDLTDSDPQVLQNLQQTLQNYGAQAPQASIWGVLKQRLTHRIYVTDKNGIVILDSANTALGRDYSRWNDVYLTLQGRYGARSSQEQAPDGQYYSVMYIAAPVIDHNNQLIGVVSVSKPSQSLQPYIDLARTRLIWTGSLLIITGLLFGAFLSWSLSSALGKLTRYARAVSQGRSTAQLPQFRGGEFALLAHSVEDMRVQLEGKAYVEHYVHALTHELKSPLAAIHGAAELLQDETPDQMQQRLISNILRESERIRLLIDRLLTLAQVEQQSTLQQPQKVSVHDLMASIITAQTVRIRQKSLQVVNDIPPALNLKADLFLLQSALDNLFENALAFVPQQGHIRCYAILDNNAQTIRIGICNEGPQIPDYALPHLTERFYSLPRPDSGRKSTGLGLNFVTEIARLHGGHCHIVNTENGVDAALILPLPTTADLNKTAGTDIHGKIMMY